MRREYKINESNLPNGCIFYAPLTENTIDLISGINGETINANVNYDTNEGCYLLSCNNSNTHSIALLYNINNWASTISNSYSLLCECKIINVSTTCYILGTGDIHSDSITYGYPQIGTHNVNGITINTWHKIAMVADYENLVQKFYLDGVLVNSLNRSSTHMTWKNNWNQTYLNFISIIFNYNNYIGSAFVKDYFILNRALNLSEIKQIQGYE